MATDYHEMSGRQKAAVLMINLGPELSSQIYSHLSDDEVEILTLELATVTKVSSEVRNKVYEEFHKLAVAKDFISEGGINYAKEVLEKAMGVERAAAIIDRLSGALQVSPFEFLKKTDPGQLLNFIQNEHPQTIALILSHLSPTQAAGVLSQLDQKLQAEVATRIAVMDRTAPDVISEVERVLEEKLESSMSTDFTTAGGIKALAEILNLVDRTTEKTIFETMDEENPALGSEIKKLMFVFEDIIILDDSGIQQVLKEVDTKELSLALKGASEEVKEKIFRNMSSRAAAMIKEDMEFMGPVKLRAAEEAQQRVVNVIRNLEESGDISISRGSEGDQFV